MITRLMPGWGDATNGAYDLEGRTLANRFRVLRMVTLRLLYPPPRGVVIGALRNTRLRRMVSQASEGIPEVWPSSYIFCPMSMVSNRRGALAASRIRSVASMISGPMPSPGATVTGIGSCSLGAITKCPSPPASLGCPLRLGPRPSHLPRTASLHRGGSPVNGGRTDPWPDALSFAPRSWHTEPSPRLSHQLMVCREWQHDASRCRRDSVGGRLSRGHLAGTTADDLFPEPSSALGRRSESGSRRG